MMVSSDTSEGPMERQRAKHRKFRGTTTVLTSILKIGSSGTRSEKMALASSSSRISYSGVNGKGRRSSNGNRRVSKVNSQQNVYPSNSTFSTYTVFHPRIPPFPGTYLTSINPPLSSLPLLPMQSPSSTHISMGLRTSPTALHMTSMHVPPEQTYYMPSHGYMQHAALSSQHSLSYYMGSPPPPSASIESYMYMKAYFRDPWSNDGFRLMILLPVGPRDDGTYGILNAGVKPEQVYSLCFYYADSILYYCVPDYGGQDFLTV